MADTKSQPTETRKETGQALTPRERDRGTRRRWEPGLGGVSSPLDLFDRVTEEMDRWWDRISRDVGVPRRSWLSRAPWGSGTRGNLWAPRVEAFQKGDRFIVRAELPGLKKDDVD